ncbi:HAMP domain-containing histidine kinase [Motiliproteus sp. MSK22-1]|uniref:HAMP domain-containing histidine kinase n=1 Tax=Motiliproteus sp. MSK22-1 TaxID=1897630 RepID=UPI000975BD9A|nr:HAMP domain-containing histidine kinase [Motiliproteus sp. MSK22-1]OMH26589.1 hypothetical protein BGP75_23100 [Motiliproteus sp. MSK22-1]
MFRLFFPLYLILILFSIAVLSGVEYLPEKLLNKEISEFDTRVSQGTFELLEDSIESIAGPAGSNIVQEDNAIAEIQPHFGYQITLMSRETSRLDDDSWQQLMNGQTVTQIIQESEIYYRRYQDTNRVLTISFGDSTAETAHRESQGTYYLIEQQLKQQPQSQWPLTIAELRPRFGFPLELQDLDPSLFNTEQLEWLLAGKILYVDRESHDWKIHKRLFDTDIILTAGPIPLPISTAKLNSIVIFILVALLAIAILLWVIPLWKSIRELSRAADAFGLGDLSARAGIRRHSALGGLASQFNTMAIQISQLINGHRELTNAVSHELRTPIARMRFGIEMLDDADNAEDRSRFLDSLNSDVDELDSLVDELLVYARFESSAPLAEPENIPLLSWFNKLIEHAKGYAGDTDITLNAKGITEHDYHLMRSRDMVRALQNLLRNASRYAHHEIRVEPVKDPSSAFSLVIHVDDDGPGVPVEHRQRIFEVFSRIEESRDKQSGGYGLGLAITRKIIESHSGTIESGESPLGGARFTISLP